MRLALLALFAAFTFLLARQWGPYAADWAPLWVAGKLALTEPLRVYDFELVTALQAEPFREVIDRPFIYPPSALLLFVPLSLIPFWASFALFSAASLVWFAWVSHKAGSDALLVAAAPPVALAAITGQPSLLVAGMVLLACMSPPVLAGVLFGIAATIKPTLLILAPVALIAGRQWVTIGSACAAGAAVCLMSLAAFGWESWALWLEAMPRFQELIARSPNFLRTAVTPYALGIRLGFESVWIIVAMAALAVPAVWLAFRNDTPALERSAILMGGALLVSPYAMFYELAVLAPLVVSRLKLIDSLVAAVWGLSLFWNASVAGLIAVFARNTAR